MESIAFQGPLLIVCIFLLLGPIVVIHELGHYWAGRAFGAAAESFSFGFGKPIFEHRDKRNTRWRFNWIPFGGFVAFVAEGQPTDGPEQPQSPLKPVGKAYMELTPLQRSVVSIAGPLANFVTAILLFAIIAFNLGQAVERVTVNDFRDGPAKSAGFEVGDELIAIDGKTIRNRNDVQRHVSYSTGDTVTFTIERQGGRLEIDVVPVRKTHENELGQKIRIGQIGVLMGIERADRLSFGAGGSLIEGVRQTGEVISLTGKMLGRLVTGREPITQLSGPVGIGDITRRVVNKTLVEPKEVPLAARFRAFGWTILQIAALISVGVGLVNLLPLPVLDGGHLVMNAYEAVTGRMLPERIQELTLRFGMICILGLAAIVTLGDIVKTGFF